MNRLLVSSFGLLLIGCLGWPVGWAAPNCLAGYFFGFNSGFVAPGAFTDALDTGYSVGAQYGYRDMSFRTAVSANYTSNGLSDNTGNSSAAYQMFSIMTNFYYDFNYEGNIIPFVGAGIGYVDGWKDTCAAGSSNCDLLPTGSQFAYQGIAGLGLQWQRFRFDLQYRYFDFTQNGGFYQNIIEGVFNIFV